MLDAEVRDDEIDRREVPRDRFQHGRGDIWVVGDAAGGDARRPATAVSSSMDLI